MKPERTLRVLVWAFALAGVFAAFAWPFAVSPDPDSATLRFLARAVTTALSLALVAAAVVRARACRAPRGG